MLTIIKPVLDLIFMITLFFLLIIGGTIPYSDTGTEYAEEYEYSDSEDNRDSESDRSSEEEWESEYGGEQEYEGITDADIEIIVESIIDSLNYLGITDADEELKTEIIDWYCDYPKEVLECMDISEWTGNILVSIGMGEYDYENYTWSPGSEQVYAFDMEVFNIDNMYSLFLEGIIPLMGNDVEITDIEEETGERNIEDGTGTQKICFQCNGNSYEYEAEMYYDWFDPEFIDYMNEVLEKEGTEKRLFVTYDGGQGCIVFYNTQDWADEYYEVMGYALAGGAG